jgi:hypothetical protein
LGNSVFSGSSQVDADQTTGWVSDVKAQLNNNEVISSSVQVSLSSTTGYSSTEHFTQGNITTVGTVTSGNVVSILPDGVVSGSEQISGITNTQLAGSIAASKLAGSIGNSKLSNSSISIAGNSVSLGGSLALSTITNGSGIVSGSEQISLSGFNTSQLSENTNLYYTDTRVKTKLDTEEVLSGSITSADITDVAAFSQSGTYTSLRAQGTTKGDVGLGNVTNESKSTMFVSPALTGNPTAPTQGVNNNSTRIATTQYVQGELTALVGTAGSTLDTLGELSASLADDSGSLASLVTTVGTKLAKSTNLSDLQDAGTARTNLGLVIGTDVQAFNSTLGTVAGGTYSGDNSIVTIGTVTTGNVQAILPGGVVSGSDQIASTFAQTILDDTTAGGVRTTIGVDASGTVNYTLPTNLAGDDVDIDTTPLSGATVISDLDINITTNTSGLVTDANGSVATRELTKSDLSLGNVDNTTDALKPVSTAGQTALNLKANIASPTFTGTPISTTPSANDSSTKIATTAYVQGELTALVGTAGSTLDTLGELSASLANDGDALTALTTVVGTKLAKSTNLSDLADAGTARTNLGVDAAGTDNSTDVTLGNTNYLSLSGQAITGGTVPIGSGGTGATSAGAARTSLGVDAAGTDNSTDVTLVTTSHDYLGISGQVITLGTIQNDDLTNSSITINGTAISLGGTVTTPDNNTQLSTEAVQDIVGAMFSGNTETRISATYVDGDGTIDLVADDMTANDNTQNTTTLSFVDSTDDIILRNTTSGAGSGTDDIKFVAGSNITLTHTDADNITISSTDTNTVYSHPTFDGDDIDIDTTALTGATVISDLDFNITTDTNGHVTDANGSISTRDLTAGDLSLGNVTNESKSTMFTDAALTGNPTAPTQASNNSSTRIATTAYVQGELTDLIGGAPAAFDTLLEISASIANGDSDVVALTTTVGTKLAKSTNLSDLANAGTARTNLGVDAAGTDNSTNVTLAGTLDYLTISGQAITRNAIVLTTDVSGVLPSANMDADTAHLSGTQTFTGAKSFDEAVNINKTTASTTKTTGALIVDGGVGVAGALNVGGDIVAYASSDERLKDNIELISNPIEKVQSLKGVTWDWNSNADILQQTLPNVGVIAQDVEKVLPQLVIDRDNGFKGVDYAKLTGLLIEAVKDQQKQIDELKSKLS